MLSIDDAVSYNYVARMVFDPVCTYPIEKFYSLPHYKKVHIVEALLKYWIDVYSKAKAEDLALVVRLDEVDA
ncbi:MAG: hypothetical protein R3213_12830, partial [Flavobacteriaceae bacterium]|nr:hypothetical protein [Flavobacteriaceae bacterium]